MSLHLPARQAVNATRACIAAKPSQRLQSLVPLTQRRNAWFGWGSKSSEETSSLGKVMSQKEKERHLAERLANRTQGASIFDDDIKAAQEQDPDPDALPGEGKSAKSAEPSLVQFAYSNMREHKERALDPDPRWRVRYQRKKIMQMVRNDGKLSKKEWLKLTEKRQASKSKPLPTSIKKLGPLSRQIVGKTVDDAMTQMRFSKKKMAREVLWQLEYAKTRAIVSRGMGLGAVNGEVLAKPRTILTKHGEKVTVQDPTRLYVDESWITQGRVRGMRIQYHARSRMSRMWRPTTRIHIVLKEEKTRMRLHDERVAKQAKKAPWVHLPNRPVTAQRPYYSW